MRTAPLLREVFLAPVGLHGNDLAAGIELEHVDHLDLHAADMHLEGKRRGVAGEEVVFADMVDGITASALPDMKILSTGEEREIALADGIKAKQIAVEALAVTQ